MIIKKKSQVQVVLVAVICICIIAVFLAPCAAARTVQKIGNGNQGQHSTDAETDSYYQWYQIFKNRNLEGVIETGNTFLQKYPHGKYSDYVKIIINFAQLSLDPDRRERAEVIRTRVKDSLADSSEQLRALIKDIASNEVQINDKSRSGATALMFASFNGDQDAVRALIAKGADIDAAETTHGWTALIYAIWGPDYFVVRKLLDSYPDVNLKDSEGWTALDHAKATGDFEMMLLLNSRPRKGQHT